MNKLVLILCLVTCCAAQPSKVIQFSLMVSEGLDLNTSSALPAVEQEVTAVNSNTSILSGYKLQYTIHRHSECNSTDSISQFLKNVKSRSDDVILGFIGCGCSPATEEVAKISSFWNIPIISYASTSAVLSDKSVFRNFFRTAPSDELLPPLLATTMQHYNWTQLAVVTEITNQYLKVLSFLRNELKTHNLSLEATVEFTTDANEEEFTVKADMVMNVQSHIVLLNAQPKWALQFLCSAYHNKRLHPNYVWILHGLYNEKWWTTMNATNCSTEQIIQALDRVITITVNPSQVEQSDTDLVSDYAVDAVRSLVLSLNQTISDNSDSSASGLSCENKMGEIVPLEEFTYDNSLMSCLIMNNLQGLNFTGRSGQVIFNEHGDRLLESAGILKQFRRLENGTLHMINFAHIFNNILDYFPTYNDSSVWQAGIPPDGTPVQVTDSIQPLLAVIVSVVSGACITFSLLCCAFMLIFRNRKVVKLTSPNLNYLIVTGTILLSIAMILYSVPATDTVVVSVLCWGRLFCVSTGHDLCFAVALLKTWRVYYIFKSRSSKKQIPKDSLLLAVTMVIIAIDVLVYGVFLIPNQVTSSASIQPNLEKLPTKNDKGVLQMFYFVDCPKSIFYYVFIIFSLGFKYILHIIAGIFAFSIRKVKVGALNDFRYVSTYVYVSSILITMYIAFVFIAGGRPTLFAGALIGILFLEIALLLSLVFIPKIVQLYRDPNGDHIFDEAQKAIEFSIANNTQKVGTTTNNV